MSVLELAVKEVKVFRVNGADYSVLFPVSIVAELEVTLGRPMRGVAPWLAISTKEVQPIIEAGLRHYHPDEAASVAAAICRELPPEEIENVIDGLCVAACPKAMERIREEMVKVRERVKKGLPSLPNVQGGAVS